MQQDLAIIYTYLHIAVRLRIPGPKPATIGLFV